MPTPGFTKNTPTSTNYVKETGFSFSCSYIQDTVYHLQTANIPSINGTPIDMGTPNSPVMIPGDVLVYDQLTITFLVDEELANFRKLHDWLRKLYTAEDTTDLSSLRAEDHMTDSLGGGVTDAIVTIRSNKQNPVARVTFKDLFPVSLSELQFTTVSDDAQNLVCTCTFAYTTYSIDYLS